MNEPKDVFYNAPIDVYEFGPKYGEPGHKGLTESFYDELDSLYSGFYGAPVDAYADYAEEAAEPALPAHGEWRPASPAKTAGAPRAKPPGGAKEPATHGDYVLLAASKGFKVGWAYHKAKERGLPLLPREQAQKLYDGAPIS